MGQRAPSAADGSRAPEGGQASAPARFLAVLALAGWAALAAGGGGIDTGDSLGGPGPAAAAWALALGAPAAAWALALAARRPALRTGPALLTAGALAGLVALTAASLSWAPAPDLAWIAADRAAIGLVALVLGLALGALVPHAPERLALGLLAAAAPVVAWALGTKVLPGALGEDGALGRLSAPLGYPNALAVVCAVAVPGALWLATRPRRAAAPLAAAALAALLLTTLLALSRSGLVALVVAGAVALPALPRRRAALSAALAGAAGAAWPAAFALTHPRLTGDGLPAAAREAAGAGLGGRLAAGLLLAAALAPVLARAAGRIPRRPLRPPRGRRLAGALGALTVLAVAGGIAVGGSAERGAVGNESGRLVATGDNGRAAWWGQALRGAADAPLVGNGGGSFPLVHLRHRDDGADAFRVREAHQMLLGVLSDLGAAGLLLTLAALAGVAWGLVRARRRGAAPALWLPAAVVAAVVAQAQVDWTWSVPAVLAAALGAAGIVLAQAGDPSGRAPRPGALAAVAAAGTACALAASGLLPWLSQRALQRGETALAEGRPAAALDAAAQARALNPLSLQPLSLRARALAARGEPGRALGAYAEMARLQPDNPRAWTFLALASGPGEAGRAAWRRVLALDPHDRRARAALG